jgi:hypothetical protein
VQSCCDRRKLHRFTGIQTLLSHILAFVSIFANLLYTVYARKVASAKFTSAAAMSELAEKFYNTLFKTKDVNADNGIFKLFSRGSVALCLLGSLLCAANQYFGDPILCHFPDTKLSNDFTKLHCWLHGSNLVPKKYREDFDCRVRMNVSFVGLY